MKPYLLALAIAVGGCSRPKQAERVPESQGDIKIQIMGWRPFSYDGHDTFDLLPDVAGTLFKDDGDWTMIGGTKAYFIEVNDTWKVIKGTQSCTLSEFISSGKLCDWRGNHEWEDDVVCGNTREDGYYYTKTKCSICHRYCRRVWAIKQEGEWEP